jgi:hypothetical protein
MAWWYAVQSGVDSSVAPLHRGSWMGAISHALDKLPGLKNFAAKGLVALAGRRG